MLALPMRTNVLVPPPPYFISNRTPSNKEISCSENHQGLMFESWTL